MERKCLVIVNVCKFRHFYICSKEDCTIPTNQTATDVTSTPVTTSIVVVGVPQMFLILVSALPVVLFLFLLLVSALLVTTCCLSARKRRYTMYSRKFEQLILKVIIDDPIL